MANIDIKVSYFFNPLSTTAVLRIHYSIYISYQLLMLVSRVNTAASKWLTAENVNIYLWFIKLDIFIIC